MSHSTHIFGPGTGTISPRDATHLVVLLVVALVLVGTILFKQESLAIAKMTARCVLYIACPENFRESLSTPTVTFPEIFNGLLFRAIL